MNQDQYLSRQAVNTAIKQSLFRTHGLVVLGLIVFIFISALVVVYVKHDYRSEFIALQKAKQAHQALLTQWDQLLLEETTWSSYERIERVATEQLDMVFPTPQTTDIVDVADQESSQE